MISNVQVTKLLLLDKQFRLHRVFNGSLLTILSKCNAVLPAIMCPSSFPLNPEIPWSGELSEPPTALVVRMRQASSGRSGARRRGDLLQLDDLVCNQASMVKAVGPGFELTPFGLSNKVHFEESTWLGRADSLQCVFPLT